MHKLLFVLLVMAVFLSVTPVRAGEFLAPRPAATRLATAIPWTPTKTPGPAVKTLAPNTPLGDGKLYHVVQKGETLWLIAVSYGVKVSDLRKLNNLAEAQDIFPGNKLLIREAYTPSPVPPTATATPYPTITRLPTWTALPSPTSTPLPVAPVAADSSRLVLAAIVGAALVLAAIFVRAGRKI